MIQEAAFEFLIAVFQVIVAGLFWMVKTAGLLAGELFITYWHYILIAVFMAILVWLFWMILKGLGAIWYWIETLLIIPLLSLLIIPLLFVLWHYGSWLAKVVGIWIGRCLLLIWLPVPGLIHTGIHRPLLVIYAVVFATIIGIGLAMAWRNDPTQFADLWQIVFEIGRHDPMAIFGQIVVIDLFRDSIMAMFFWTGGCVVFGYAIGIIAVGRVAMRVFKERQRAQAFLDDVSMSALHKLTPD